MANVVAVGCVDPRFQGEYDRWLRDKFGVGGYYSVRLAGTCFNQWAVVEQVATIAKLTELTHVVLLPHEDCRMYGERSQIEDLNKVRNVIRTLFPTVQIYVYMYCLDGSHQPMSHMLDV